MRTEDKCDKCGGVIELYCDCKVKVLIEMVKILCEDDQTVLDLVEHQAIERIKNEKIND